MDKCWTKRARGVCRWSLQLPGLHVEGLWPHFPPLKMSVWLQMKHSSVKWNERSRSNCWIETCNYASSCSLSHISTAGASLEGRSAETVSSEGSEDRTPKVAPESKEKRRPRVKSQFPLSGRNGNLCCNQGGFLYSGVSIATVSMCPFYHLAEFLLCNMWKADKCQMLYDC